MKLSPGSVILVHGYVFMAGLESGCKYVIVKSFADIYHLRKYRGSKRFCHYAHNVDLWLGDKNSDNWIEVITQGG